MFNEIKFFNDRRKFWLERPKERSKVKSSNFVDEDERNKN